VTPTIAHRIPLIVHNGHRSFALISIFGGPNLLNDQI
jgi:hypothetical protein